MGKSASKNRSPDSGACSWNMDDVLESFQDADRKIREFLEQKKRDEEAKEVPGTGNEADAPAS